MQKVKAFFHIFTRSLLPQTEYYQKVLKTRLSFSFKYFFALVFFLNLLFILIICTKIDPIKIDSLLLNLNQSLSQYPDNLTISIKKGSLMTTYDRPYLLWMNEKTNKHLLAVVDETAADDKIRDYNSVLLITKKNLVVKNYKDVTQPIILPLNNISDQVIDKTAMTNVSYYLGKMKQFFIPFFVTTIIILIILMPVFSFLLNLIYISLASLIVYLIYKLWGKKTHVVTYGKTLKLAFHAITLPLTLDYGLTLFNLKSKPSPLLFLFLVTIFIFAAVYEAYLDKNQSLHVPHKLRRKQTSGV